MNKKITVHNVAKNKIFEREMSAEELTSYKKNYDAFEAEFAEIEISKKEQLLLKESAISKLTAIGLTESEVTALVG